MGQEMYILDVDEKKDLTGTFELQVSSDNNTGEVKVTISVDTWEKIWYTMDCQDNLIRSLSNGTMRGMPKDLIETLRCWPSDIASRRFGGKTSSRM
jgi:hypothetical protein